MIGFVVKQSFAFLFLCFWLLLLFWLPSVCCYITRGTRGERKTNGGLDWVVLYII